MSRNELCACGSGKRYKQCHGRIGSAAPNALHVEALSAHRAGALTRAEALYRRAIEASADHVASLHMLGVLQFERMRYREALDLLWEAAERTDWTDPGVRRNLGLVLAKFLSPGADARQEALVTAYLDRTRRRKASLAIATSVSVVLPIHDGARSAARAVASVAAQRYANMELIVIDAGSTNGTASTVADCLSGLPFPAKLFRRAHRGEAQAANEGAERADGQYVAFLDADDWFAPDRVESMVAEIARSTPLWGFSRIAYAGDADSTASGRSESPGSATVPPRDFDGYEPVSFTLLNRDVAGSSGNLFVERSLFREHGGYRDIAQHRGWDLCVRLAEAVEPVVVERQLYFGGNRSEEPESALPAQSALDGMAAALLSDALTRDASAANEFCPQHHLNRGVLLRRALSAARGDRIPVPVLKAAAAACRASTVATKHAAQKAPSREPRTRTAVVVLGIYRSGTSAFARTLNLCGAALPDRLVAARLGMNPKGYWETEAVNHLDARLLQYLGGTWDRVDFDLPTSGPIVEEFLADARELLTTEYGNAPLILIKDPRICVVAPLWHRALRDNGYRPAYVVPVRNSLEVARSLEAHGDKAVADGLALWLTYMQRIEAFVDSGNVDFTHASYPELLDDWRSVVQRIARRLALELDTQQRADEVDRFLEAGMRNQRATDADLDAHLIGATGDAVRAMHRRLLERCAREAEIPAGAGDPGVARHTDP